MILLLYLVVVVTFEVRKGRGSVGGVVPSGEGSFEVPRRPLTSLVVCRVLGVLLKQFLGALEPDPSVVVRKVDVGPEGERGGELLIGDGGLDVRGREQVESLKVRREGHSCPM